MPKIIGIMAASNDGVVGKNNGLPWNYPDELEHFRRTVHGQVMVMGRKTFATTPADLFKQTPIVFSKHKTEVNKTLANRCTVVASLQEFKMHLNHLACQKIFMIGGAEIAELFLKNQLLSEFILTKIHKDYAGDARIDLRYFDQWHQREIMKTDDYTMYNFTNLKGGSNAIS